MEILETYHKSKRTYGDLLSAYEKNPKIDASKQDQLLKTNRKR